MLTLRQVLERNSSYIGYEKLPEQISVVQEALELYWSLGEEGRMVEHVCLEVCGCCFRLPWCIEKPDCVKTCTGPAMLVDDCFMCVDDRCMRSCCRSDCASPEYYATRYYHGLNRDPSFEDYMLRFVFLDDRDCRTDIVVTGRDENGHKASHVYKGEDPPEFCDRKEDLPEAYEDGADEGSECEDYPAEPGDGNCRDNPIWTRVEEICREKGCGAVLVYAVHPHGKEEQVAILEASQESSRVREYRVMNFPRDKKEIMVSGKRPMPNLGKHDLDKPFPVENMTALRDLISSVRELRNKNPDEAAKFELLARAHWIKRQSDKEPGNGITPAILQSGDRRGDSTCGDYNLISVN